MTWARVSAVAGVELRSILRRPLWWLLAAGAAGSTVVLTTTAGLPSGSGPQGEMEPFANSVYALTFFFALSGFLLFGFFASILGGLSVIRDGEHRLDGLIHSTPLGPIEYVAGKLGGVLTALSLALLIQVAALVVFQGLLGAGSAAVGPWSPLHYALPVALFAAPALVGFAGLALAVGARTRQPLAVLVVPVVLLFTLPFFLTWGPPGLSDRVDAALMILDPSGLRWYFRSALAPGLTVGEVNGGGMPYDAILALNRSLWALVVIAALTVSLRWVGPLRAEKTRQHGPTSLPAALDALEDERPGHTAVDAAAAPAPSDQGIGLGSPVGPTAGSGGTRGLTWGVTWALTRTEIRASLRQPALWGFLALLLALVWSEGAAAYGPFGEPLVRTAGSVATAVYGTVTFAFCAILLFLVVEGMHAWEATGVGPLVYATVARTPALVVSRTLGGLGVSVLLIGALVIAATPLLLLQPTPRVAVWPFVLVWGGFLIPTLVLWGGFATAAYAVLRNRYTTYAVAFGALMLTLWHLQRPSASWLTNWPMVGALQWTEMGSFELDRTAILLNRGLALTAGVALLALSGRLFRRVEVDPVRRLELRAPGRLLQAALSFVLWMIPPIVLAAALGQHVRSGAQGTRADQWAQDYWRANANAAGTLPLPTLTHVDLEVRLDPPTRSTTVRGTYRLLNRQDRTLTHLPFTVRPPLQAVEWTLDGRSATWEDRSGLHVLEAEGGIAPGDSVRIGFAYNGRFPPGSTRNGGGVEQFVLPSGVVLHTLRDSFLPELGVDSQIGVGSHNHADPAPAAQELSGPEARTPQEALFTSEVRVDVPAGYSATSVGHRIRTDTTDGRIRSTWTADTPVSALNVVAGRWKEMRRDSAAVLYDPAHAQNAEAILDALVAARTSYSEWFGAYPWGELRLNEVPGLTRNAIGFPTNIVFSEHLGFRSRPVEGVSTSFVVTAHEVAHQWWGNLVAAGRGPGSDHLVEGMASYASLLLVEHHLGAEAGRSLREQMETAYLRGRRADREEPVGRIAGDAVVGGRAVVVDRGAWVQWMLHDVMGREQALDGLRSFVENYRGGPVLPGFPELLDHLRRAAPDTLAFDRFADQWFLDAVLPEFVIEDAVVSPAGDGWTVDALIRNLGSGDVRVSVGIQTDETMHLRQVRVRPGAPGLIRIRTPQRPREVVVDPNVDMLQVGRERARETLADPGPKGLIP